jgi:aldehyde dehydrogenase (NAD+)
MANEDIRLILENQRNFFSTGKTMDIGYRLENLKKLKSLILEHEQDIVEALWKDFRKPEFEVIATETRFVIKELNLAIRRLKSWTRPKRVRTPILHFLAHSYIIPQPYGQVLVLSPWNFPFQLAFLPMIGALAAGNCVVVKVSRQVPSVMNVMEKILNNLPQELVALMNGDHSVSEYLLNYRFDYIFFTGSCEIGRYVMQKAAGNLTPVTLELGGKNPCIIAEDAKLEFAARRIVWGKFLNAGQTCISPDYLIVHKKIRDKFISLIKKEINTFYEGKTFESTSFARIINSTNVTRLSELMKGRNIIEGGITNEEDRYVSPTIVTDVLPDDPLMKEEIFGPVLPLLVFEDLDEIFPIIEKNPKPLASYIFTNNKKLIRKFLNKTQSGSVGINDTVTQIASPYLPYGGVACSGLGRYHGKASFETFSNMRSVLAKSNLLDIPVRYPPYNNFKNRIIKLLMR